MNLFDYHGGSRTRTRGAIAYPQRQGREWNHKTILTFNEPVEIPVSCFRRAHTSSGSRFAVRTATSSDPEPA